MVVVARMEGRGRVDTSIKDQVERILREVLAPLVKTDGGDMYLVRWEGEDVHIHLAGACAGCPGASMTNDGVILPAVRSVAPKAGVIVTTGVRIPDGALKLS
jgi:Fe-S cluster biogenesis protein NfuA